MAVRLDGEYAVERRRIGGIGQETRFTAFQGGFVERAYFLADVASIEAVSEQGGLPGGEAPACFDGEI